MRLFRPCIILTLCLASGSCIVPSLHPLYTASDVIAEVRLPGVWTDGDREEIWRFSEGKDGAYVLRITDEEGRVAVLDIHAVRLDGQLFLDVYPAEPPEASSPYYEIHRLPVHTFLRVDALEPSLRLSCLDVDWFKETVSNQPDTVAFAEYDKESYVLTAPTTQLQAFLRDQLDNPAAFTDAAELWPVPAPNKEAPAGDASP